MIFTISICIALYYVVCCYIMYTRILQLTSIYNNKVVEGFVDVLFIVVLSPLLAPLIIIILGWQKLHEL